MNRQVLVFVAIFFSLNSTSSQELNLIWENTYGGNGKETLYSVQPNGNGGYIMGGYTTSGLNGDISTPSFGNSDFLVINVNSTGQIIWDKRFGMIGSESLNEIVPLPKGGFIIGGITNMNTYTEINDRLGIEKFLVYKISAEGDIIWQKMLGGSGDDELQSIQLSPDGGVIIGGRSNSVDGDVQSRSNYTFEYWDFDFWVVKLNFDGEIVWENSFGKSDSWDGLWHILSVADGYLLGGATARDKNGNSTSLNAPLKMSLIKIDFEGNFIWEKIFGGSNNDYLTQIVQSDDGGYLLVGETMSIDEDVQSRKDKNIIASDDKDCWVVKVDNNGEFMWEQYYGGFSYEITFSASKINNGGYTVVGGTRSSALNGLDQGDFDFWVFNIDNNGQMKWDQRFGGSNSESATSIFQINETEYLLGGYTRSSDGDVQSRPNGGQDYWMLKADLTRSLSSENFDLLKFDLYPNPVLNEFTIRLENDIKLINVNIYNNLGQLIISKNKEIIETTQLSKGIYYVEVITNQGKSTKKIIIE